MIVQLATRAKLEFDAALAYLSQQNSRAADDLASRLNAAINSLADFPNRGRPGSIDGTREIVAPRTPYVIVYLVLADRVLVARIRHTSQDPSPE